MSADALVIEPLDRERHDRAGFSSGVAAVDNFLRRTAGKMERADNLRVRVLTRDGTTILGFFALRVHMVDYHDLPKAYARNRPIDGTIPAGFIAMMGVSKAHQNERHGNLLMADALVRLARADREAAMAVVILDVLDCGEPERVERRVRFYESFGFTPLPSRPQRMFMPIAAVRETMRTHGLG